MKYPHLFSPIKVGGVVFRNRIFASPTGYTDIKNDYSLTDQAILYYERKAAGGAAAVCIGECQIDHPRSSRGGVCIDLSNPRSTKYLGTLADKINRHGAVASAELQHCGRYGGLGLGPSVGIVDGKETKAMTEEEILSTIEAYGNAAKHAKERGFKMVTVHGGHGWLPEQFFSRATNQRTDKWGGSLENRCRFAVAVCDIIHEKCGANFPVEFRISATELDFGYDVDEGIEYAMALDGHADIIHVSAGVHGTLSDDNWLISSPGMFSEEGLLVKYAAEIKKHVKHSLIATVGSISDPEMMEDIIASGKADFVAVARALLCDPDLPNKARAGKTEDVRPCIKCMSCWSTLLSGGIYCALNPQTSREAELGAALPPHDNLDVAVIGGGIAGMQAALTAAENGHKVTLYEKGSALGGAIRCEEEVPFKKHLKKYITYQAAHLEKAGVDIKLNTEATAELLGSAEHDMIIAAVGSHPTVPKIDGIDLPHVRPAQDAFAAPDKLGKSIVIIGAGLVGCELSLYLTDLGHEVHIVEQLGAISSGGLGTQVRLVKIQLNERSIPVHFNSKVTAITADGVEYTCGGETHFIPADSVVYAVGQTPNAESAMQFAPLAPYFQMIGDCTGVSNIMGAVKNAVTVARDIGRK